MDIYPCATESDSLYVNSKTSSNNKEFLTRAQRSLTNNTYPLYGRLMNHVVKKSVRPDGTYKFRKDKSTRCFGGVNTFMFGDWCQLQPVAGAWLCSNPLRISEGTRARRALDFFWEQGRDTVNRFWALTTLQRCADPWYNAFLGQCRDRNLTSDMYSFFHGLPTLTAAIKTCTCNSDVIEDSIIGTYKKSWANAFKDGTTDIATVIQRTECEKCAMERQR